LVLLGEIVWSQRGLKYLGISLGDEIIIKKETGKVKVLSKKM